MPQANNPKTGMQPPKRMVIEMTSKDVSDNLMSIVGGMNSIREECIANLRYTNEQQQDYLRMTSELASCVNVIARENEVTEHLMVVDALVRRDGLLRFYDPLQEGFWQKREPNLSLALDDLCAVVLRHDFMGVSDRYHVFQALKYMTTRDPGVKASQSSAQNPDLFDLYGTILPVNGVMSNNSLESPELASYLMKKLLSGSFSADSSVGLGVRLDIDTETLVKAFQELGALYVDVGEKEYAVMKKIFPGTIMVSEKANGAEKKHARVIFGRDSTPTPLPNHAYKKMSQVAEISVNSEDNLVRKARNVYNFGKKFIEELSAKSGTSGKPSLDVVVTNPLESFVVDEYAIDNGQKRNHDVSVAYWNDNVNDGRVMASTSELYSFFKQVKGMVEGSDKARGDRLIACLRDDFDWPGKNNFLWSADRFLYQAESLNATLVRHYGCNKKDLVKETELVVPEYLGIPITDVTSQAKGLSFIQALLGTQDDADAIMETFECISNMTRDKIKVWTPPLRSSTYTTRKEGASRAVSFLYYGGYFLISCYSDIDGLSGRSRGVRYNAP